MREGHTPFKVLGFEQVTSIATAKKLPTVPNGCTACLIQAEAQPVRWRVGTDPTTAVGMRLLTTEEALFLPFAPHDVRVIEEASAGKVNVTYLGQ